MLAHRQRPESVPVLLSLVGGVRCTLQGVKLKHFSVGCDRQNACQAAFVFPRVSSEMSDPDRRRAPRIALQQAVSLVIGNDGHEVAAITENLSSAGVLLYADQLIRAGSEVGLILVVPAAQAETEGKWMWCFGEGSSSGKRIEGRKVRHGYRISAFRSTVPGLERKTLSHAR